MTDSNADEAARLLVRGLASTYSAPCDLCSELRAVAFKLDTAAVCRSCDSINLAADGQKDDSARAAHDAAMLRHMAEVLEGEADVLEGVLPI